MGKRYIYIGRGMEKKEREEGKQAVGRGMEKNEREEGKR